jgi:hypothetical protein
MARRSLLALILLAVLITGCSGGDADAVQNTQSVEPADTEIEEVEVETEEQQPPPEDAEPGQGPGKPGEGMPGGRGFDISQIDLAAAAEVLCPADADLTSARSIWPPPPSSLA